MTIAYLNGQFLPIEDAKISPLDRGFLFGDGIYEVIPSYAGRLVGGQLHAIRMANGLREIGIEFNNNIHAPDWQMIAQQLVDKNQAVLGEHIGVYIHVSRGADSKRFHAYPTGVTPTVFAFAFGIPASNKADRRSVTGLKVNTEQDLRWRRCHIKSTSLLGNVMHFQHSQDQGVNETILYNEQGLVTEASVCNVFMVKEGKVYTPPLDNQLLPGITRRMVIDSLHKDGTLTVSERQIGLDELKSADEVWLTSSSKEIAPVVEIDGKAIGQGEVGRVWEQALASYHTHKFSF
ncbi:aminotransferase class IV [Alteromonas oceanisediminis]|uniref:aminotransferase class IV n=1 Tax=Alteromonas oceanisediminis TaxID=2836180 RepID=UPI001BD9C60E|nr:aminotransferase class IV [Alteromonas oceanisediminis]MBT0586407.1 aminotransferase class IV [Alteromonas oceanisediminis]